MIYPHFLGGTMERCSQYVGVACVDGSCPVALREEYAEIGADVIKDCRECWKYKGCEDCGLSSTELCYKGGEDK